jgi:UDP-glucose 4-epimerase
LVKGYQQCYGIDYIIIRPSTVYGPFNDETKRLIDVWILNLLTGKDLKIFGDENKTLDFTYIDDFIDGFILAMGQKNREFDISYGAGVKLVDVANHLIKLNGSGKIEFCSPETAQPQEVELDISAMKEIGYAPKIDVFHGVEKTYDWYKTNVDKIVEERR